MKCIIACDMNGGIGYKNKLPWHKIEGDLNRFRGLTENKIVIMGKNTWESLPIKPLPKRVNIVISNTLKEELVLTLPNIGKLKFLNDAWVIGGAKLIDSLWDYITEIHVTQTFRAYNCDTYINLDKLNNLYNCVSEEIFNDHTYKIYSVK